MTRMNAGTGVLAAGILALACAAAGPPRAEPANDATVVLGTFDSRAIAVAYGNSDPFRAYITGLRQELEDAKASGDDARAAELEAFGPSQSVACHHARRING